MRDFGAVGSDLVDGSPHWFICRQNLDFCLGMLRLRVAFTNVLLDAREQALHHIQRLAQLIQGDE